MPLVRRRHAVPNALLPVVSLAALNFGFILSGAIAVEAIYSWPGLGQATIEAIRGPDYAMLQGLFLLFSASLILANLIVDLTYGYLDPRVRGAMTRRPGWRSRRSTQKQFVRQRRRRAFVDFWRRLRQDRLAMLGLIVLIGFALMALLAPWLSPKSGLSASAVGRQPLVGAARAATTRSAPTISVGRWRPSSSGARASRCSSVWRRPCSRSRSGR